MSSKKQPDWMAALISSTVATDNKPGKMNAGGQKKGKRKQQQLNEGDSMKINKTIKPYVESKKKSATFEIIKSTPISTEIIPESTPAESTPALQTTTKNKKKQITNTLRAAHTSTSTSTPASRKASELWYRKAGYGPLLFEQYYRGQPSGVINDCEFGRFMEALARPLAISFRVRVGDSNTNTVVSKLRNDLRKLGDSIVSNVPYDRTHEIYKCAPSIHKKSLQKHGTHHGSPIEQLITQGVKDGVLCRQEIVSMLPVFCLQVEPGEVVLDLCASPGSKTMQILENLCKNGKTGDEKSSGMVCANDIHPMRVNTLIEAIGRHNKTKQEMSKLVVTCHNGELFPMPTRPFANNKKQKQKEKGFDKVLVDVPCSGDGTIRKDPSILPRWSPSISTNLHLIQVQIAYRGLQVLKVGGVMVYSTCTPNPIEDEAVVSELHRLGNSITPGSVELIPWPHEVLPGLIRRPGVDFWKVADHVETSAEDDEDDEIKLRWHASYEDGVKAGMNGCTKSLWPRQQEEGMNLNLNLKHCSRFLPHDQDTGGFFVALLRKNKVINTDLPKTQGKGKAKAKDKSNADKEGSCRPLNNSAINKIVEHHNVKESVIQHRLRTNVDYNVNLVPVELSSFLERYNDDGDEDDGNDSNDSGNRINVHSAGVNIFKSDDKGDGFKLCKGLGKGILEEIEE